MFYGKFEYLTLQLCGRDRGGLNFLQEVDVFIMPPTLTEPILNIFQENGFLGETVKL